MAYIQLGDICNIVKGEIGITKATPGDYPMVTTGEFRKSHNEFQLDTEAVLVPLVSGTGHGHASIKRVHYQEGKFAFGSILAACVPKDENYSAKFLYIYFNLMKDFVLVPLMKGSANVSLTLGNLKRAKVPNISLETQLKIVELYSKIKIEQDKARDLIDNQMDDITLLRQSILQEAIQGKLTTDWRTCHPELAEGSHHANELLKRIQKEKAQLIKDKKIKKEKALPAITEEEIPYELPDGWVWCRFQEIFDIRDGTHDSPKNVSDKDSYPLVTSKDFKNGKISLENAKRISKEDYNKIIQRSLVEEDDILFSMIGGNLGNQVIVKGNVDFAIKNVALFKYYDKSLSVPDFLKTFSEHIAYAVQEKASGGAQPFVSLTFLRQMLTPLPPLEEQKAIVEKVNALMELCDGLRQEVKQSQEQSELLMKSCLREVFEGGIKTVEI
jgi:type I restriction enzyme S subunit